MYVMGDYGGPAAYGALSGPVVPGFVAAPGIDTDSHDLASGVPEDLDGAGIAIDIIKQRSNGWFHGLAYVGQFVDGKDSLGNAGLDTDSVHANLLDRSQADQVSLNGFFDDGQVDFASDDIEIDRHTGDMVIGKRMPVSERLTAFWKAGTRLAYIDTDRDVRYVNLEGATDTDTVRIRNGSEMYGVGPMLGAGAQLRFRNGWMISSQSMFATLYANYDLDRSEVAFNESANTTGTRRAKQDTNGVVPVVETSLELMKDVGKYYLGIGYNVSAWLGGARSLQNNLQDDIDDETNAYLINEDDIILQGFYGRVGVRFGHEDPMPMK